MKLKISRFTLIFVYISLFVMTMLWASTGCGPGPTSYSIPDFYSPVFTRLAPEVFRETSENGLTYNVRIKAVDNVGSPKVKLLAKKYGTSAFVEFPMTGSEGSVFSASLPVDYISFDYYFAATDGINATAFPIGAPNVFYSYLVGVPTIEANQYYGIEPALVLRPNSSVTISADITTDSTLKTGFPKLYLREVGGTETLYVMAATGEVLAGKQKYTLTLSETKFTVDKTKYEYRIEAENAISTAYYPSKTTYNNFEINASINLPPVAIIKYDTAKKYFVTTDYSGASDIDLDASTSYDPEDGKTGLVYKWTQISGPTVATKDSGSHFYFTPAVIG
ncbi:MAG TPA: hypothetical protein PKK26_05030, partial [Candidatus Wallbacteria bacterium]|nr:hypothetical protein [Candidatus Wallbacteria bacterium]